jgi:hypothetical protein
MDTVRFEHRAGAEAHGFPDRPGRPAARGVSEWIPARAGMPYDRRMRALILLAPLLLLAACEPEPENVQARAETLSRQLEERANEIEAEASNDVEARAEPLENEADALLNQLAGNESGNEFPPANVQ